MSGDAYRSQERKHGERLNYNGHLIEFLAVPFGASNTGRHLLSCKCLTCNVEVHPASTWAEQHANGVT